MYNNIWVHMHSKCAGNYWMRFWKCKRNFDQIQKSPKAPCKYMMFLGHCLNPIWTLKTPTHLCLCIPLGGTSRPSTMQSKQANLQQDPKSSRDPLPSLSYFQADCFMARSVKKRPPLWPWVHTTCINNKLMMAGYKGHTELKRVEVENIHSFIFSRCLPCVGLWGAGASSQMYLLISRIFYHH